MKIMCPCHECIKTALEGGREPPKAHAVVSPSDSGLYNFQCPQGHNAEYMLQQMRFEVLFDIGAYAIRDGYFREAVSSFASALERFLEVYIRVACRLNRIEQPTLDAAWKTVNSQSERQLGAYLFLYLITEQGVAPYLPPNMVALRNSVIHKGKLASREDAIGFGNTVLSIINPTLRLLKERNRELLGTMVAENLNEIGQSRKASLCSVLSIPTILSISLDGRPDISDLGTWTPPTFLG